MSLPSQVSGANARVTAGNVATLDSVIPDKVFFGNSVFAIFSRSAGYAYFSSNGIDWSQVAVPAGAKSAHTYFSATARHLVFGESDGTVLSMTQAGAYTQSSFPSTFYPLCAASSPTLAVVVGYAGSGLPVIYTSTDGITWTARTAPLSDMTLRGIVYGRGAFVAVGSSSSGAGRLLTSTDGVTWSAVSGTPFTSTERINSVTFRQGATAAQDLYVAISGIPGGGGVVSGRVFTSSTLASWTNGSIYGTKELFDICLAGTRFFAVGADGTGLYSENAVSSDVDANSWVSVNMFPSVNLKSIAYGNSTLVRPDLEEGARYSTSVTAPVWNPSRLRMAQSWACGTAHASSFAIFTSTFPTKGLRGLRSSDGRNWNSIALPAGWVAESVASSGSRAVAVSYYGGLQSTDLVTWSAITLDSTSNAYTGITRSSAGLFVAVSEYHNRVARSTDGLTWSTSTVTGSYSGTSVAYGGSVYVSASSGSGGTPVLRSSSDAVTWTNRTLPTIDLNHGSGAYTMYSPAVAYGSGAFCVCYTLYDPLESILSFVVLRSTDGISWSVVTVTGAPAPYMPSALQLATIVWTGRRFLLRLTNSAAFESFNGITWSAVPVSVNHNFYVAAPRKTLAVWSSTVTELKEA